MSRILCLLYSKNTIRHMRLSDLYGNKVWNQTVEASSDTAESRQHGSTEKHLGYIEWPVFGGTIELVSWIFTIHFALPGLSFLTRRTSTCIQG
jgi:hypothetical protein